jgi:Cysteine-rich secretory protein family
MRFLGRFFSYTPFFNSLRSPVLRGVSISVAIVLVALSSPARADEQNATVQTDTAPIANPPLPRPKPPLLDATGGNPAMLISAFRHQCGEDSVVISAALTRVAQEQANAMATRDLLDYDALAPFSRRIGPSGLNRAAENIAYGYADFASTLKQWINSAAHRANLLLHDAKWIGVAHAQNSHRTYWAMVIGAK